MPLLIIAERGKDVAVPMCAQTEIMIALLVSSLSAVCMVVGRQAGQSCCHSYKAAAPGAQPKHAQSSQQPGWHLPGPLLPTFWLLHGTFK
jgi:hypothetical protein